MKADPAPGRLGDVGVGAAMRSEEKAEEGGVKAQRRGDWVVGEETRMRTGALLARQRGR